MCTLCNIECFPEVHEFLDPEFINSVVAERIAEVRRERTKVFEGLVALSKRRDFFVKDSQANFFLIRWPSQERCLAAYQGLIEQGILARNISGGKGLAGCLRISLGTVQQNDLILKAAAQVF